MIELAQIVAGWPLVALDGGDRRRPGVAGRPAAQRAQPRRCTSCAGRCRRSPSPSGRGSPRRQGARTRSSWRRRRWNGSTARSTAGRRRQSGALVDAHSLARAAVGRWQARARLAEGSLELRWNAGRAVVNGDRCALAQALDNLIVNAIEHGGPTIVVAARLREGRLRIAVVDSGRASRPRRRRDSPGRGGRPALRAQPPRPRPRGRAAGRLRPRRPLRSAPGRTRARWPCSSCRLPKRSRGGRHEQAGARRGLPAARPACRGPRGRHRRWLWLQRRAGLRAAALGRGRRSPSCDPGKPLDGRGRFAALELRRVPARFVPPGALEAPEDALGLVPIAAIPAGSYLLATQLRPPGSAGRGRLWTGPAAPPGRDLGQRRRSAARRRRGAAGREGRCGGDDRTERVAARAGPT